MLLRVYLGLKISVAIGLGLCASFQVRLMVVIVQSVLVYVVTTALQKERIWWKLWLTLV